MNRLIRSALCALSLIFLLTACGAGPREEILPEDGDSKDAWDEAWNEAWSRMESAADGVQEGKSHYYQVLNEQEEELYAITDEIQVEALDDLLGNMGQTRQTELPEAEEIACVYVFQQEKTRLAGEAADSEREYEEVARFTVYQDQDLVTMQFLKGLENRAVAGIRLEDFLTFTVSVSPETMEKLRDPAQFAE